MARPESIETFEEFARNLDAHVRHLRETRLPERVAVAGGGEIVVQDAEAYEALLTRLDQAETLEGIRRGLADVAAGRFEPAEDALAEIRRKHEIPTED